MTRRLFHQRKWQSRRATGPTSPAGKLRASRNAIKHGLSGDPEFSASEALRVEHIRHVLIALVDHPANAQHDIQECAILQTLIERTVMLRHEAHSSDTATITELQRLVRYENRLINRRNKLLETFDDDEYAAIDSSALVAQHK